MITNSLGWNYYALSPGTSEIKTQPSIIELYAPSETANNNKNYLNHSEKPLIQLEAVATLETE